MASIQDSSHRSFKSWKWKELLRHSTISGGAKTWGKRLPCRPSTAADLLLGGDAAEKGAAKGSKPNESKEEADKRVAKLQKELAQWFDKLNYTEKVKIHIARAFIMNPEIMVMHRPLYHFDEGSGKKMLELINAHHKNRGMCMPLTTMGRRRPRTVFITTDETQDWQEANSDVVEARPQEENDDGAQAQVVSAERKWAYALLETPRRKRQGQKCL